MIGRSLSLCVCDILQGRVAIEDVDKIVTSTKFETAEHWHEGIESYKEYYWSENPELAEKIVWQLLAAGKIDQPRTRGESRFRTQSIRDNLWVATEEEV